MCEVRNLNIPNDKRASRIIIQHDENDTTRLNCLLFYNFISDKFPVRIKQPSGTVY